MFDQLSPVHYIPVLTTMLSVMFSGILFRHYITRGRNTHVLWWMLGVVAYGLGTALEASITLTGNSVALTKAWYIAGALLGGYPLAQGNVYFHLKRKTAHILTCISLPFMIFLAIATVASPVILENLESFRPSGKILEWVWIRYCTPFLNLYALFFLAGGTLMSAMKFYQDRAMKHRFIGNTLITIGALLPAVGGTYAKMGHVEVLYITEFLGLIFIWSGYKFCIR